MKPGDYVTVQSAIGPIRIRVSSVDHYHRQVYGKRRNEAGELVSSGAFPMPKVGR